MHHERLRPSSNVRASISNDGLVLLDLDGGLVLSSNEIGARIWQLIEQQQTPAEIAQQLSTEYSVTCERTQADVAAFVAALVDRGLVVEGSRS